MAAGIGAIGIALAVSCVVARWDPGTKGQRAPAPSETAYPAVQRLVYENLERPSGKPLPISFLCAGDHAAAAAAPVSSATLAAFEEPQRLVANVDFAAREYDCARVTLQVSKGSHCTLKWTSDLEPLFSQCPGVSIPIIPDERSHTYSLPLSHVFAETWRGRVNRLAFTPSDVPADVTFSDFQLVSSSSTLQPEDITIDRETRPAISASRITWDVTVPPFGTFAVWLGLQSRAWQELDTDGARFEVDVVANGERKSLVDKTLNPLLVRDDRTWMQVSRSLGAYAGKRIRLECAIDTLKSSMGDYAFWGDPVILSPQRARAATPVFLFSCDALRADHVGCYGYSRPTSPHIDALAQEAVVFENAIAQEAWTLTSHMTMLTGLYPKNHGLTKSENLPDDIPTLPEMLARHGYFTVGATGHNTWLLPWRGYGRGFDAYDVPFRTRKAEDTKKIALDWIHKRSGLPLFMFLHFFDTHFKAEDDHYNRVYDTGDERFHRFAREADTDHTHEREGGTRNQDGAIFKGIRVGDLSINEHERQYLIACYDDCIAYEDNVIGELIAALKQNNIYDQSLIIITGDHGEAFGEHGAYQHIRAYEECCHVPLIIKFPGGRFGGRRVGEVVQLVDLVPTVLDTLGMPPPAVCDGQSLLRVLTGESAPRNFAFTHRILQQAYRNRNMKLIRTTSDNSYALYDLAVDPGETKNIYDSDSPEVAALQKTLEAFFTPDAEGWHVAFSNDGAEWNGAITLISDSAITGANLLRAGRNDFLDLASQTYSVEGAVHLGPRLGVEELLIKTASPYAKIKMTLASPAPFSLGNRVISASPLPFKLAAPIALGNENGQDKPSLYVELDPVNTRFGQGRPQTMTEEAITGVYIWHQGPRKGQSPAKELDEEQEKALKAIGYL